MKKKVREKFSHSTKLSSKRTGNGKKIIAFCIVFSSQLYAPMQIADEALESLMIMLD